MGLLLLPLIIRYFNRHLIPQAYIGIAIAIFAGVIFLLRKQLYRYFEFLALAIICAIIGISIANSTILVNTPAALSYFYMGYALASMHRLLGYGVFRFQIMISFQIITLILRFTLISVPDVTLLLVLVGQEIFVGMVSYAVEKNERGLFESLYKSNKLLLKFKQLLTEYLPNPILIFSNDYTNLYFHNDAFKKAFKCEETPKIKAGLSRLILDADSVEKNKSLIAQLGYFEDQAINLSDFIDSVSQNLHLIRGDAEILNVQVTEKEGEEFDLSKTKEAFPRSSRRSAHGYDQVFSPSFPTRPKDKEVLIQTRQTISSLGDAKLTLKEALPKETENLVARTKLESENATRDIADKEADKNSFRDSAVNSSLDENKKRIFVVKIFTLVWDNSEALAILMDNVTHERTIMELKVADKNKDMIITMISHELRTPLNGILGLIDISKKMLKQADVVPYINACKNSGILLLNLVNSILDLSQIKAHKLRLFYSEFSIHELISKIVPLFDYFCLIKKLFLRIDVDPNVPPTLITDKNRLSQILINLIGNAFKFTFQGGITLKVELEGEIPNRVKFTVKDTGIGIEKDKQNRLFKLFGRIDNQNEKINTSGVGLGLTISNTLALLLDPLKRGIQVDSSLGVGSSFFFVVQSKPPEVLKNTPYEEKSWDDINSGLLEEDRDLTVSKKVNTYTTNSIKTLLKPIETDQGARPAGEFAVSRANFLSLSPQKVSNSLETYAKPWCMIVDDNPFNLVVATHIMQERGYQIVTALNGQEALAVAQKAREDAKVLRVILMDCQMPVMDGYQATKHLTEMMKEELVDKCPIIAPTANHQSDKHTKLCNEVGMSGCLSKPLQVDELEDMLKKVESIKA